MGIDNVALILLACAIGMEDLECGVDKIPNINQPSSHTYYLCVENKDKELYHPTMKDQDGNILIFSCNRINA